MVLKALENITIPNTEERQNYTSVQQEVDQAKDNITNYTTLNSERQENIHRVQEEVSPHISVLSDGGYFIPISLENENIPQLLAQENVIIEEISVDTVDINTYTNDVIQKKSENEKEKKFEDGIEEYSISIQNDDLKNEQPPRKKTKFVVTREKRAENKYLRMRGKAYKGLKKDEDGKYKLIKEVGSRKIGPPCTSKKCQKSKVFQCNLFTEIERTEIFKKFWEYLTWDMKRTYISSLVDSVPAKRKKENSRRNETLLYSLKKGTEKVRVCKKMFLATLGVNEWTVREYSSRQHGMHVAEENNSMEKRGRNTSSNKEKRDLLNTFLENLPKMPSHYCRTSTSNLYLEPTFQSKAELFEEYCQYCEINGCSPLSNKILFKTLKEKKIKLYRPRKDQCDLCIGHKLGNISDEIFSLHQQRKEQARRSKDEDKKSSKENNEKVGVVTVDVQAVKLAPMLKASAIYYKTKLCVHNYTVYNLFNGDVVCYLWDESQGGLDANIFASLLTDYLSSYLTKMSDTKELIIYSDGCGYQNKNCVLSNALLKFSVENKITIYQKFFEKGHSQMEVDSVHATIERKLKNKDIYLPTDYISVCREARKTNPYLVKYINYSDFKNFSKVQYYKSIRPGYKTGDPKVADIHCLMYLPSGEIKYKINYDEDWQDFSKRPKKEDYPVEQLYKSRLKIKTEKFMHLQALKIVLDNQFWEYYDNLPHD